MPNTLTNIMPQILARGLMVLREQAVMPRLAQSDYGSEAKRKGEYISIPVGSTGNPRDVSPSVTESSATNHAPTEVQIPLDQWKFDDFFLTDNEMVKIQREAHFVPLAMASVVKGLANQADAYLHSKAKALYGFVGTAGTTPYGDAVGIRSSTLARAALNKQLAPLNDRVCVLDPDAEAAALGLPAFSDVEKSSDRGPKIEGEIGRKLGFDHFMSQNVQTHLAGTASAATILVQAEGAVGATTVAVIGNTGESGTIEPGDIITFAGDAQTYVVTNASTVAVDAQGASNVTIDPPLKETASVGADVDVKATHVMNLAFHTQCFAFGTRPLMEATRDVVGGNQLFSATDPVTGLSLRLEIKRQNKQTAWEFDLLYGGGVPQPAYGVRIAG